MGSVKVMPISPTASVMGKPMAKMFICGAMREIDAQRKVGKHEHPNHGQRNPQAAGKKVFAQLVDIHLRKCLQKVLLQRECFKTAGDRHQHHQVPVHHHKQE